MKFKHYETKPLDNEGMEFLLKLTIMNRDFKADLDKSYEEAKDKDFICKVLEKRIKVFNLPKFEPSAILFISLLAEGNPGKSVLMLIETLEKHANNQPFDRYTALLKEKSTACDPIDVNFICTNVYPFGFYTDEAFAEIWDKRKANPEEGFNFLI